MFASQKGACTAEQGIYGFHDRDVEPSRFVWMAKAFRGRKQMLRRESENWAENNRFIKD